MSIHGRFPASPPISSSSSSSSPHSPSTPDLKQRIISSLNKLSDRDTLSLASSELESIARNLTHESFSTFLNCIHNTDSSCKSPVRKHCVALLSVMSRYHGEALVPHLTKMVSTVLRRLRDSDSSVRSACVTATADMSALITTQPFSSVVKPLLETLIQEGDSNVQIGAALCLAAAIEAATDPESENLKKSLPKLGKLLKSDGFKAKPALLTAVGSIITAGGGGTKLVLDWLIPVLIEFLSSEDWTARKSAAEALSKIAAAEQLALHYKKTCTAALENRRFDKVKSVRETMNQALNQWKQVSNEFNEASLSPSTGDSYPSITRSSTIDVSFKFSRTKKVTPIIKRSPSLPVNRSNSGTRQKENLPKQNLNKGPQFPVVKTKSLGPDIIKHTISEKCREDDKVNDFTGLKSSSKVAPCSDNVEADEVDVSKKDSEELCLIREQLALIENQQSSLLDLLQKFMGSSQSGIKSLESRVSGLEMVLDQISSDIAVSNGNTEFMGPKVWRKSTIKGEV